MRILLTGASGYLGSRLVEIAQEAGHTIVLVDYSVEREWVWDRPEILGVDALIHLAAMTDLYACEQNPDDSWRVNYWGTVLAGRFCWNYRLPLVFASTDTVLNADFERYSIYDNHKYAAERCVSSMPDLKAVTLRFSTIYGPSPTQSKKQRGVLNKWVSLAHSGEPIKVYQSVVDCQRDYLYIDDAVYALLRAIHAPHGNYNVGTSVATRMMDVAHMISDKVEIVPDPDGLHPIEKRTGVYRNEIFRVAADWSPTVDLPMGLYRTRQWIAQG